MVEAQITQAVAVARLGQTDRAQHLFRDAIERACQINALNVAGLAALALIEEIENLSPSMLQAAYRQAREWLANSQSPDIKLRLADAADRIVAGVYTELSADESTEILTEAGGLREKLRKYEEVVIKQALAQVNGSVTHAASLLEINYQSLAYIIESRHPHLLKERTPVRRRPRRQ
jgi:hypothetical protein